MKSRCHTAVGSGSVVKKMMSPPPPNTQKLPLVPMIINITKDELVARVSNHNRGTFLVKIKKLLT